jgi:hypothetical protein
VAPADLTLWLLATLVEGFVVCLFLLQGLLRKFLVLNLYFALCVTSSLGRYVVISNLGISSFWYRQFYIFSDALLTSFLFFSVCELSVRLAGNKWRPRKVALLGAGALIATAWFSLGSVSQSGFRTSYFAYEFSQNLYYVCGLAAIVLWVWKLRNDPADPTAGRLVGVLAVYFSLYFLAYGATQYLFALARYAHALGNLYATIGLWLPLGCGSAAVSDE